jgi:hypothetical protein
MLGSKICLRNKLRPGLLLAVAGFAALLLVGCGGTEEAHKETSPDLSRKEFLSKYEKTFNPADYDVDVNLVKAEERRLHSALDGPSLFVPALPETISGFRIQVFLTQEIDEATIMRDSVSGQVTDAWVYVIYDSPYYKVRVGNYADHPSANAALKKLAAMGYKDALVVPDNVFKNPPPKPPDIQIEPEPPLEQHR